MTRDPLWHCECRKTGTPRADPCGGRFSRRRWSCALLSHGDVPPCTHTCHSKSALILPLYPHSSSPRGYQRIAVMLRLPRGHQHVGATRSTRDYAEDTCDAKRLLCDHAGMRSTRFASQSGYIKTARAHTAASSRQFARTTTLLIKTRSSTSPLSSPTRSHPACSCSINFF